MNSNLSVGCIHFLGCISMQLLQPGATRIKNCVIIQKTTSFDRNLSFSVIFALLRVVCTSFGDICFASDMPAGVWGVYNITETAGFNIISRRENITPLKTFHRERINYCPQNSLRIGAFLSLNLPSEFLQ